MFGRQSPAKMLEVVLKDYQELAAGDPHRLREFIPAKEVWRFFIERRRQQHGRRLALAKAFHDPQFLSLTIKQYIERVENLDFEQEKIGESSRLLKQMRKHRWTLSKEDCEKLTLKDVLQIDRGWIPFDIDEPGYLKAAILTFQEVFAAAQPLNLDFILRLHALILHNVAGTNYEGVDDKTGAFRGSPEMGFILTKSCASEDGIKEFFDRRHPEQFIELRVFKKNSQIGSIFIHAGSLQAIKDFIGNYEFSKQPGVTMSGGDDVLKKHCQADNLTRFFKYLKSDARLMGILSKIAKAKNNEEIAYCLYSIIDDPYENAQIFFLSSQQQYDAVGEMLRNEMQNLLQEFDAAFTQAKTTLDKLKAIVKYISACGLLHPFADANGRVFHMVLPNYLLFREKLPLAIFNNSNHFNLYSQEEMLRELITGMANTLKLIKDGSLFKVVTDDILRELRSKPAFQPLLAYFQEVQKIEEEGRVSCQRKLASRF